METKKQIGDLAIFAGFAQQYIGKFPDKRNLLTFALQKLIKKNSTKITAFQERCEELKSDAEVEFCLKDKATGAFVEKEHTIHGQLIMRKQFDAAGEKNKKDKIDTGLKILKSELVDFEPHFVPVPDDIDISWISVFTGFVFEELTEEQELDWYLKQEKKSIEKKE